MNYQIQYIFWCKQNVCVNCQFARHYRELSKWYGRDVEWFSRRFLCGSFCALCLYRILFLAPILICLKTVFASLRIYTCFDNWYKKHYMYLSISYICVLLLGISKYLVITLSNPLINHERGNLRGHWAYIHIRKLSHGARRALKKNNIPYNRDGWRLWLIILKF